MRGYFEAEGSDLVAVQKLLDQVLDELQRLYGDKLLAVVLFGSTIYSPHMAHDVDLVVVVKEHISDNLLQEHVEVTRRLLERTGYDKSLDVHVLTLDELRECMKAGTFLAGLALGFRVLYDRCGIRKIICDFLRELADYTHPVVLVNRHGIFDLRVFSRAMLPVLCSEA